jgi:hypothetical protein
MTLGTSRWSSRAPVAGELLCRRATGAGYSQDLYSPLGTHRHPEPCCNCHCARILDHSAFAKILGRAESGAGAVVDGVAQLLGTQPDTLLLLLMSWRSRSSDEQLLV